jgi:type I restriction enzyme, S subunit
VTNTGFLIEEHYGRNQSLHWPRVRAKHFLREIDARSETGDEEVLGLSGIRGVLRRSDMGQRASEAASYVGYKHVREGQLISNKMQAWNGMFGISPYDGITSPDYAVYEFSSHVVPRFVEYVCRTDLYSAEFHCRSKGMGTGFLRLNSSEFLSTEFWLPPVGIQLLIADFLDRETARIDQLIEKKQRLLTVINEREDTALRSLLSGAEMSATNRKSTDTLWLSSVPDHWEIIPLRHLVRITTGRRDTQDRTDDGQFPFYVRSMTVERIDTYSYDEEAVLTSGDGAGVGKVFHHVTGKFELHQRMYAFTDFTKLTGRYFFHFLRTFFHLQMTQWSAKSTVDSVRMPFLKSMLFAIPPHEEQEKILAVIDTRRHLDERLVTATENSIERLLEFRAALITAAVTGQIDVTTWCKEGQTDRRLDQIDEAMRA